MTNIHKFLEKNQDYLFKNKIITSPEHQIHQ